MCELTKNLKAKSRIGYKVAVKKDGKYYSPSMGHEYKTGDVPIITEQKEISGYFREDLLIRCFEENMVGRTAAFVKKENAKQLWYNIHKDNAYLLDLVILKIKLSKELMIGTLLLTGNLYPVIAGKHMEILGEVE